MLAHGATPRPPANASSNDAARDLLIVDRLQRLLVFRRRQVAEVDAPADIGEKALGWEVDTRLTWRSDGPWSLALEWDRFTPGSLTEDLVTDADIMQLFAAMVRYAF